MTSAALERVPFADYASMPEVNASSLWELHQSPRLYRYRRDHAREDSDELRQGRAAHTALFEPHRFLRDYVLWEGGRRAGKEWDAFRVAHSSKTILTEEQYEKAVRIADAARAHPVASKYLSERGKPELTIKWTHSRTGLKCKSRLDWLCSAIVDLKTARDVSPAKFSTAAARYGYLFSQAFYGDAVAAELGETLPQKIIAVQSAEPFDVVVYDLPDEELQKGRDQYEAAIDRLIECQRTGEWPGLAPSEEVTLRLPAWATPEAEEEQLTMNGESLF